MAKAHFKENSLFRGWQAHYRMNARVGNNGGPYDLYDYADGYFEATRLLLEEAQKPGIVIDIVVYPICLTYRHAIELFIKYLIHDLAKLTKTEERFRKNHGLAENWALAKKLIAAAKLKASEPELEAIGEVVACMEEVDPRGEIFRYPESIKSEQHLKDWSLINLLVLEQSRAKTFKIAHNLHHSLEARLRSCLRALRSASVPSSASSSSSALSGGRGQASGFHRVSANC